MGINLVAFIWGLAEATLFFIVPDVWLTGVAVKDRKKALLACLYALAGALIGGGVMYFWGSHDPSSAQAIVNKVPGIPDSFLSRVAGDLEKEGVPAMLFGPLQGIPYKLYALFSGSMGLSLPAFILWSVPARLVRFVLAALISGWIFDTGLKAWTLKQKYVFLAAFWIIFYGWYFYYVGGR